MNLAFFASAWYNDKNGLWIDEELKENPLHLSKAILLLFSRDYRHELPRNELEKFSQEVRNELLNLDYLLD